MNTPTHHSVTPNVQDFLALEPFVKAKIICGWSGKHNLIKAIFKPEAFNNDHLNKELIPKDSLVTLFLQDVPSNLDELLPTLLEHSLAGVFLIGNYIPALPSTLINSANEKKLPIISLDSDLVSVDFSRYLDLICKLKENDTFIDIVKNSYYELFLQKSKTELLDHLEKLVNNPILVFNKAWQPVNWNLEHAEIFAGQDQKKIVGQIIRKTKATRINLKQDKLTSFHNSVTVNKENYDYMIVPLIFKTQLFGHLIALETKTEFSDLDIVLLKQGALVILQELISAKKIEDVEKKYQGEFIYDLLHFNFESEAELRSRGKLWGLDLSLPHHLLVLKLMSTDSKYHNSDLVDGLKAIVNETISSKGSKPVVAEIHDTLAIIFPVEELEGNHKIKKNISDLAKLIQGKFQKEFAKTSVAIGIGKYYKSITDLGKSFQEAKTALELSRFLERDQHITCFEDLGIIRLLANISYQQLEDYYKEYLTALIDYDLKNKTNFEETLQIYFQKNGDINDTAEKLFLHPNTLRYRLKKIEEITNSDLQKLEDQINLSIACKIAKMSSQP